MAKKYYSFMIEPELAEALKVLKVRDGIPEAVQIRRALREWLGSRGVAIPEPGVSEPVAAPVREDLPAPELEAKLERTRVRPPFPMVPPPIAPFGGSVGNGRLPDIPMLDSIDKDFLATIQSEDGEGEALKGE